MKTFFRAGLAGLMILSAGQAIAQTASAGGPYPPPLPVGTLPPEPIKGVIKIVLVGDSTIQVRSGWGGAFCADHVSSLAACVNLGRGGRSSGTYIAEGSWDIALSEMAAPGFTATYVLIQMGHNDQGYVAGRTGRGRATDITVQFPANMRRYVEETRARGAIPILVTPLTRRQFIDGRLQNDLAPWAEVVRRVASETGTPLVDLNAASVNAVQALGPVLSARFAQPQPSPQVAEALFTGTTIDKSVGLPPQPATPAPTLAAGPAIALKAPAPVEALGYSRLAFDYTHLGPDGAAFFSAMVTRELVTAAPALRSYLIP